MAVSDDSLAQHHVLVRSDNEFQREARLRQALWRETKGYPIGEHRGLPLGSRLAMPFAQQILANYVTEGIRHVVRSEVENAEKLYRAPRIYDDLLSSQPLCFNLFAELRLDLDLASRTLTHMMGRTLRVTTVEFEYSPGRGDPRFTSDRSAFDVFVVYEASGTRSSFLGIEVKYVEDLNVDEARHRPRYDEIARAMGIFDPDRLRRLRRRPLEQFWRDHLLACSMLIHPELGFEHGAFVVLYPSRNEIVTTAVRDYGSCLRDERTFTTWTLEDVLDALDGAGAGGWAGEVRDRYLGGIP